MTVASPSKSSSPKKNRRQLKLRRRPRRSAIAASRSELGALVDLGSFAATDYILSFNQLEKNYIDREMFAPNDLSAHFPHEEQSEKRVKKILLAV